MQNCTSKDIKMTGFILAYLTLGIYILVLGMKRFKKNKLKISLISILAIYIGLTVGARIVWYIYTRPRRYKAFI